MIFLVGQLSCAQALGAPTAHSVTQLTESKAKSQTLVSFAPSNTELIYSLGGQKRLIGCCSYCDYPSSVKSLTRTGSFESANLERMARLKPQTVLLVNGQERLAAMLAHNGYHAVTLKNNSLSDISANLRSIGRLTENASQGDLVASVFDNCLKDLGSIVAKSKARPRVLFCVWPDPLLIVGKDSYLNDALTACGGTSISSDFKSAYPHLSLERLVMSNPDVIILPYEARGKSFLSKPPWSSLKAVKTGQIIFLPDTQHDGLSRPTLRIIPGIEWLAAKLHPELAQELSSWLIRSNKVLTNAAAAQI